MIEERERKQFEQLRQRGVTSECRPVKSILFKKNMQHDLIMDCYISIGGRFVTVWENPGELPSMYNIDCIESIKGIGPATDGIEEHFVVLPKSPNY